MARAVDFTFPDERLEEILYFLAGSAEYTIGEETGTVAAGDVVLVPAGALHTFDARDDVDAIAVFRLAPRRSALTAA